MGMDRQWENIRAAMARRRLCRDRMRTSAYLGEWKALLKQTTVLARDCIAHLRERESEGRDDGEADL